MYPKGQLDPLQYFAHTQAMTLIDGRSLQDLVHVHLPRCSPSSSQDVHQHARLCGTAMTDRSLAIRRGHSGWNNWSGGMCAESARNPHDRRFITLDGFVMLS